MLPDKALNEWGRLRFGDLAGLADCRRGRPCREVLHRLGTAVDEQRYPGITIKVMPTLQNDPAMEEIVLDRLQDCIVNDATLPVTPDGITAKSRQIIDARLGSAGDARFERSAEWCKLRGPRCRRRKLNPGQIARFGLCQPAFIPGLLAVALAQLSLT